MLNYLQGRMKLPWPLSTREALIHYFEFEYLQDDLIIVLWNTVGIYRYITLSKFCFLLCFSGVRIVEMCLKQTFLSTQISDLESIDKSTHGFTQDGIPDAKDVVRIDIVGGLALQKVSANRSYFRLVTYHVLLLKIWYCKCYMNFISILYHDLKNQ